MTLAILAMDGMEDPADLGMGKQRRDGAFRLLRKKKSSASSRQMTSPRLAAKPALKAEAWPPFDLKTGRMRSP